MGFKSIMKKIGKIGLTQGVPIQAAVGMIHKDEKRPNDDAVTVLAGVMDELDARLDVIEKKLGIAEK